MNDETGHMKCRFDDKKPPLLSPAAPGQLSLAAAAAAPAPEVTPSVPPPSKKVASSLARQLCKEETDGG
jgi:hypothetical protein